MILSLFFYLYASVAHAVITLSAFDIIGDWSDTPCSQSYVAFKSNGSYEYRVWNGERYALETSMYWRIQEGMVVISALPYAAPAAVIAVETMLPEGFVGAYAMADGTTKGLVMLKCK